MWQVREESGVRHHREMTETPESRNEPTAAAAVGQAAEPPARWERHSRVNQIAAGVAIVAGVVFVVAVIFFAGFFVGASSGGHMRDGDYRMGPGGMMDQWQSGQRGQMGPGGMMGPGQMGPGGPTTMPAVPSTPRP